MAVAAIKIEGLVEFNRALRKIDTNAPKALRLVFNAAADTVVQEALPTIPRRTGRARAAVRARSTRTAARVAGGNAKAPYYPWLDFGGKVGRNRSVNRPFQTQGRYLYAAYFRERDSGRFAEMLVKALNDLVRDNGLAVD